MDTAVAKLSRIIVDPGAPVSMRLGAANLVLGHAKDAGMREDNEARLSELPGRRRFEAYRAVPGAPKGRKPILRG